MPVKKFNIMYAVYAIQFVLALFLYFWLLPTLIDLRSTAALWAAIIIGVSALPIMVTFNIMFDRFIKSRQKENIIL